MKLLILSTAAFLVFFCSCNNSTEAPSDASATNTETMDSQTLTPADTGNSNVTEIPQPGPATPAGPASNAVPKNIKTNTEVVTLKSNAPATSPNATTPPAQNAPPVKVQIQAPELKTETPKPKAEPTPAPVKKEHNEPPSHAAFDKILSQYVSDEGKVNYKGLKSQKDALKAYTDLLANNPVQDSWSRNEKLAYWINVYNAFTLTLILDNYPVTSITKLDGGKPWDVKRITLGDKKYSLNDIENNIIRPQFKDARIHFAVNCAAKSCPPLLNHAYTATNLNTYFEQQARNFINDTGFNIIRINDIRISKIFEWYSADFGNIIAFLNKFSDTRINENAKISYLEYNWELNQ